MISLSSRRAANAAGFLACAALLGYAFYAQYVQGLDPCPLCLFQRFVVIGLGVVFLIAALHNPKFWGARVYAVLLVLVALIGIGISAKHIWIQAQPPGSIAACGASLSYLVDIMPIFDVIKKVLGGSGECQHVDKLLGISWPWWTAFAMTVLGAWAVATNWMRKA
jgi:protein dithiol:quinone oxidoreductase